MQRVTTKTGAMNLPLKNSSQLIHVLTDAATNSVLASPLIILLPNSDLLQTLSLDLSLMV